MERKKEREMNKRKKKTIHRSTHMSFLEKKTKTKKREIEKHQHLFSSINKTKGSFSIGWQKQSQRSITKHFCSAFLNEKFLIWLMSKRKSKRKAFFGILEFYAMNWWKYKPIPQWLKQNIWCNELFEEDSQVQKNHVITSL
jgi:hypothetical protein